MDGGWVQFSQNVFHPKCNITLQLALSIWLILLSMNHTYIFLLFLIFDILENQKICELLFICHFVAFD